MKRSSDPIAASRATGSSHDSTMRSKGIGVPPFVATRIMVTSDRGRACRSMAPVIALVLVVLSGHVTDRTTGQPIAGAHVTVSGATHASTSTGSNGEYVLRNLHPGSYSLTIFSNDVPRVQHSVTIGSRNATQDFTVCSTTLDYSCAGGPGEPPG
jgi:protocatechuate 3,4-dioxygenase beta subunit